MIDTKIRIDDLLIQSHDDGVLLTAADGADLLLIPEEKVHSFTRAVIMANHRG